MWFDKNSRLRKAIRHGKLSDVSSLIQKGADINHSCFYDNRPLEIAIRIGQLDILNLLIQKGAIINPDEPGDTPLQYAETSDVVRALVEAGVNAYSQHSVLVRTAIKTMGKGDDKLKMLLDAGVNVDARNLQGETPLIALIHEICRECTAGSMDEIKSWFKWKVKFFINQGADINAKSTNGQTALIWSAFWNAVQITRILLDAGADPNLKNNDGLTAIKLAAAKGHEHVVKILLKAGAIE
jgi:ankyrin repeat protein